MSLAAAKLHSRALKYLARLVDEQSQAPAIVIEAQAEPPRILSDPHHCPSRTA